VKPANATPLLSWPPLPQPRRPCWPNSAQSGNPWQVRQLGQRFGRFLRPDGFQYGVLAIWPSLVRMHLADRDLACWCPLDQSCHADVLLEIANGVSR